MITTTTKYKLNTTPLDYIERVECDVVDIDYIIKNVQYEEVLDIIPSQYAEVLEIMFYNIKDYKKYQLVDVKVQDLKVGQYTANGLWHLDSSLNPVDAYENYLFVVGKNTTEFVVTPIRIDHHVNKKEFHDDIERRTNGVVKIKSNTIIKYNGSNVHRGPKVTVNEKRLLIRLINTDKKLPKTFKKL